MLENAGVTAFTISELLRETQNGPGVGAGEGKITKLGWKCGDKNQIFKNFYLLSILFRL